MGHAQHRLTRINLLFLALLIPPGLLSQQEESPDCASREKPQQRTAMPPSQIQEVVVAEVPSGRKIIAQYSVDGHLIWIEEAGDTKSVWLDGRQSGTAYDELRFVTYWPEAKRLAFVGKRNSRLMLVADGVESSVSYKNMGEPVLYPDGRLAAPAAREHKFRLLVDGEETGPEYQDLWPPRFSPDGKHSLYFAKRHGKYIAVLDGKEIGTEMDSLDLPLHNLNVAHVRGEEDEMYFSDIWPFHYGYPSFATLGWIYPPLVQTRAASRRVHYTPMFWTADGKHSVFASGIRSKSTWVVDGLPGPTFEAISPITFSKDGAHFAFAGGTRRGFLKASVVGTLVLDGNITEEFKGDTCMLEGLGYFSTYCYGISNPQYAWNGDLIYARRMGSDVFVKFKGEDGPKLINVESAIMLSDDGEHIHYVASRRDGGKVCPAELRDQQPLPGRLPPLFRIELTMADKQAISLAYVVIAGSGFEFKRGSTNRAHRRFIINGQQGPDYNAHSLWGNFSGDGRHYFYVVEGAKDTRDLVVFDGFEGKLYDGVLAESIQFRDDKTLEFFARQGRQLLKVTQKLP